MVLPFLDDIAFFNTDGEVFRGGIWDPSVRPERKFNADTSTADEESILPIATPVMEPTDFAESPIDIPTSPEDNLNTSSANLRHRKTTPNLRTYASDANMAMDNPPPLPTRATTEAHDPLDHSQRSSFDLNEHIGELPLDAKLNKDSKATIVGAVKKWGNWYLRKNSNTQDEAGSSQQPKPKTESNSDFLRRKSSPSLASKQERAAFERQQRQQQRREAEKQLKAPKPHKFPVELMDSLDSPEARDHDPLPSKPVSRSKSLKEPRRSRNTWDSESAGVTDSVPDPEWNEKHSVNPSLSILKKPTSSAAITVPLQSQDNSGSSSPAIRVPSYKKGSAVSSLSSSLSSHSSTEKERSIPPLPIDEVQSTPHVSEPVRTPVESTPQDIFDMDSAETTPAPATVKRSLTQHAVKRKAVGSGTSKHSHSKSLDKIATATVSDDQPNPELDVKSSPKQRPENRPTSGSSFTSPKLAPPLPMLERSAQREKNFGDRDTPYLSEQLQLSQDGGNESIPLPESAAAPHSHEKDLNDFLIDTANKFDTLPPMQFQGPAPRSPPAKSKSPATTSSATFANNRPASKNYDAPSSGISQSQNTPSSPEPVLGYRKGKPKQQNQGFKLF